MGINPVLNHDADNNVLGNTEINVDVLLRFLTTTKSNISQSIL